MSEQELEALLEQYRKGECSPDEIVRIESWFLAYAHASRVEEEDVVIDYDGLREEIWKNIAPAAVPVKPISSRKLWPAQRYGLTVAAAVAMIAFGIYFFVAPGHLNSWSTLTAGRDLQKYDHDISPGRYGATITLANGEVIQLDSAKTGVIVGSTLKYNDGTVLKPSLPSVERAVSLTASTSKGQTYSFTLPDGTKVWLNADSKLEFPSQFTGKERRVKLSGEGYFAVKHHAKQPFFVESSTADGKTQIVEDIGTAFNINAYADEASIKTTLVEGSAAVYADGRGNESVTLIPNQQAVLSKNQVKIKTIDPATFIAWKNNEFMFESQNIQEIMRVVARWYDVEVVYIGDLPTARFTGGLSRFDNVSKVLGMLEKIGGASFEIKGRVIYVQK